MFSFLKRKKPEHAPVLADLHHQPLSEGDTVEALRYDLGVCRVVSTDQGMAYRSVESGRQVSWHRMVDASTALQKVKKVVKEKE